MNRKLEDLGEIADTFQSHGFNVDDVYRFVQAIAKDFQVVGGSETFQAEHTVQEGLPRVRMMVLSETDEPVKSSELSRYASRAFRGSYGTPAFFIPPMDGNEAMIVFHGPILKKLLEEHGREGLDAFMAVAGHEAGHVIKLHRKSESQNRYGRTLGIGDTALRATLECEADTVLAQHYDKIAGRAIDKPGDAFRLAGVVGMEWRLGLHSPSAHDRDQAELQASKVINGYPTLNGRTAMMNALFEAYQEGEWAPGHDQLQYDPGTCAITSPAALSVQQDKLIRKE